MVDDELRKPIIEPPSVLSDIPPITALDKPPLSPLVAQPEAGSSFAVIQKAINNLNIPTDTLPSHLQGQYESLSSRKNPDGSEMTDEEFKIKSDQFVRELQESGDALNPEQKQRLAEMQKAFASGAVKPQDTLKAMREYANNPDNKLENAAEANQIIDDLDQEFKDPSENHHGKIRESLGKLLRIFKMLGLAIAALLGVGIMKGMAGGKG